MNISFQSRLVAFFLAFLMFFTSIGYSMDVHYCGGEIQSIGFFGKTEACQMHKEINKEVKQTCCHALEVKEAVCHQSKKDVVEEKDCCHNETICVTVDGDFEASKLLNAKVSQNIIFTALYLCNSFLINNTQETKASYLSYLPPVLIEDVAVLHQVFVI